MEAAEDEVAEVGEERVGEHLAQHLPHARLEVLGGAAHAPFVSDPEAVCRLVTGFCHE